jgi:predicted dehydrogenase
MDDVELVGVVDTDISQARELASRHGIPQFTKYEKLLDKAEAIIIATPTETHYEIARDVLARGIHVFMEKPITSKIEDAEKLIALAAANNVALQIGHLERFSPAFRHAYPLIHNPLYIGASRVSPFTGRSTDVDVVLDLMIHDLDLALFIVKGDVVDVKAEGTPVVTETIDMASARIEFSNGCVANLSVSRVAQKRERVFRIFQRKRYFSLDLLRGKMTTATKNKEGAIDVEEYEAETIDPVKDELREFVGAIADKRKPHVEGEHGLQALILANRVKESIYEYIAKTNAFQDL